jgi:hypothetical protein
MLRSGTDAIMRASTPEHRYGRRIATHKTFSASTTWVVAVATLGATVGVASWLSLGCVPNCT